MGLLKFIITIIFFTTFPAFGLETISGTPRIIDGDTIIINQHKIRFHGIDAPEIKQICKRDFLVISFIKFYKDYACGELSKKKLKKKINNKKLLCNIKKNKDRYGRYLATCFLNKTNINSWMVRSGYAIAYRGYSKKYIFDEEYAKKNNLGLWKGSFIEPEKWRKSR